MTWNMTSVLLYLDPGSGSMLLQMLLAGVAGAAVFLKFQGRRLMGLFRKDDPAETVEVEGSSADNGPQP